MLTPIRIGRKGAMHVYLVNGSARITQSANVLDSSGLRHTNHRTYGCAAKLIVVSYRESSISQKIQARSSASKGSATSGTLPGRNICATSMAASVAAAPAAAYRIRQPLSRNSQTKVPKANSFPKNIVNAATRSVSNKAWNGAQEKAVAVLVNWKETGCEILSAP